MPKVILLGGYARSGKNTAAEALISRGFAETSFALPIRKLVYNLFNLDKSLLGNKSYEDSVTLAGGKSLRDALIHFGEQGRAFWPDIWAQQCYKRVNKLVKENQSVVITDWRRVNEAETLDLLSSPKVTVLFLYVENPRIILQEKTYIPFIKRRTKLYASPPEREVDKLKPWVENHPNGFVVKNSRTIEYLHNQVLDLVY